MKVYLLNKDAFGDMARNAVHAAFTCTGNEHKLPQTNIKSFLCEIIKKGHESILEHINLTFRIEDISRALLQELSRHRHISLSVQSTRSTLKKTLTSNTRAGHLFGALRRVLLDASDVLPEPIKKTADNLKDSCLLHEALDNSVTVFTILMQMEKESKVFVPDYLKYLLPECMPTDLVMTVNARELRHIFLLRSQPEALLEFRRLVARLYAAIPEGWDVLFSNVIHSNVMNRLEELTTDSDIGNDDDEDKE